MTGKIIPTPSPTSQLASTNNPVITSSSNLSSPGSSETSVSSASQSSNSILVAISPTPTPKPTCNTGSNKFMARDDMMNQINSFCQEAAKQGTQDKNGSSILRTYNQGGRYEVDLSIDWPHGIDIKNNMQIYCSNNMTSVMGTCDSDAVENPLNWKTGGTLQVDPVTYRITPQSNQNYTAGKCSFHIEEFQSFLGRKDKHVIFDVQIRHMRDGIGNDVSIVGTEQNHTQRLGKIAGDGNPYIFNTALPSPLVITPELNGTSPNYIQFVYGSQSWTTNINSGMPYCSVGDWDSPVTLLGAVSNRNTDCYFYC